MNIVFSFFINMGFFDVAYIQKGPSDLTFCLDENCFKWTEITERPATDQYLAMICKGDLEKGVKGDFTEKGEELKKKNFWIT